MQRQVFDAFPLRTSLAAAGFSARKLLEMFRSIKEEELDLNSLLLLRGGRLAFEYHASPYQPSTPRDSFSVIKSFVSVAVGMAVDRGLLGLDEPMVDIFPEYRPPNPSANLLAMTVRHLFTMSTGHDGEALWWVPDDCDDVARWFMGLDVPHPPGERCRYENPTFLVLEEVLRRRTGRSFQEFLHDELFSRIGIDSVSWVVMEPPGLAMKLRVTPLDYARFGLLLQNRGRWGDEQVVSEEWVQAATSKQVAYPEGKRANWYGYLFWCDNAGGFSASGDHGQRILVRPDEDLVAVMTGTEPNHGRIYDLLVEALPADGPEAEPAQSEADLAEFLAELNQPPQWEVQLPPAAEVMSGAVCHFAPRAYYTPTELTLHFARGDTFSIDLRGEQGNSSRLTGSLDGSYYLQWLDPGNAFGFMGHRQAGTQVAARGRWVSGKAFEFELRPLSYGVCQRYRLRLEGDGVELYCKCNRREETLHPLSL